jgi:hypothetical protein
MQPGPGVHGHGAVLVVVADQGGGRNRPGGGVGAVELGAVAARPAGLARWWGRWIGIEAAVGAQPDQHRHARLGQVQGELGGVVAGIEHHQGDRAAGAQAPKQRADLHGGLLVGVVQRVQPGRVDRGGPGIAVKAQLGDPLPGPAGDDRLAGRVAGGMVVVAARRRALGVAARPGGHVHREHQRVGVGQAACEQVAQPLGLDAPAGQRGVGAAPAAAVGRLEAELATEGTDGAHSSASPSSNSASARRVRQACSSVRNAASCVRGKVGIGMAAQPDRTEHRQAS